MLPGTPITCHLFDMDGLDTSATGLYVALAPSTTTNLDYTDAFNPGSPSAGYKVYTYGSSSNPLTLTPTTTLQLPGGTTITQGADITFNAPITDGEYAVLIHVSDTAANKINLTAATRDVPVPNSSTNPNPDPNPGQPLTASSQYLSLFVSNSNPTVVVNAPNDGSYLAAFTASGTVEDPVGLAQLLVTIGNNAAVPGGPFADGGSKYGQLDVSQSTPLQHGTYISSSFQGKNKLGP